MCLAVAHVCQCALSNAFPCVSTGNTGAAGHIADTAVLSGIPDMPVEALAGVAFVCAAAAVTAVHV